MRKYDSTVLFRRILSKLVDGIWDFLDLLDLQPLEADPVIELLVQHMGNKLTTTGTTERCEGSGTELSARESKEVNSFFKPKRNVDANILWLKLNCR